MIRMVERVYRKAAFARAFELALEDRVKTGTVKCPVYLSTGQEYPSATVAVWCEDHGIRPHIFVQHRAHSQYLAFGGDLDSLIRQIAFGPEGSNCIQSKAARIYGHDALLGTQVPIATGYAYATCEPVICFLGDAAAEEDYALASFGWAATHRLPILYVVEDNNLSILTEKCVRRSWDVQDVARGFGLSAGSSSDDPDTLYAGIPDVEHWPALLNVFTTRLRWHSGAGCDGKAFDRHAQLKMEIPDDIDVEMQQLVETAWSLYEM